MLHLGLVQHGESADPLLVLQGVQQQCAKGVLVCLKRVPMLLLEASLLGTVVQLLPRMVLPLVAIGISYEAFSSLLHFVQHGGVALGTAHPGKWAVLDDTPHLCLVQL